MLLKIVQALYTVNGKDDIWSKGTVSNITYTPYSSTDLILKDDLHFKSDFHFDYETVTLNLLSNALLSVFGKIGYYHEAIWKRTEDIKLMLEQIGRSSNHL